MMGKTRGNTTDASAKYSYNTRISFSSVVYLTRVASTVSTSACVGKLVRISGSNKQFDSPETEARALLHSLWLVLDGGVGD